MPNKKPSGLYDALMGGVSGIPAALEGVAGLPGDIQSGAQSAAEKIVHYNNAAMRYLWNNTHGSGQSWADANQQEAAHEAQVNAAQSAAALKLAKAHPYISALISGPHFPTGEGVGQGVDTAIGNISGGKYSGIYQPQTGYGRTAQSLVANTLGALAPAGEATLAQRLAIAGVGSLTGSAGREAVHAAAPGNPGLEATADVLGNLAGGLTVGGAQALRSAKAQTPQEGERLAARIMQEKMVDPEGAAATIAQHNAAVAPGLHEKFNPTFSQVVGTPDAQDLERKVAGLTNSKAIPLQQRATMAASGLPPQGMPDLGDVAPMGTGKLADAPNVFSREALSSEARQKAVDDAAAAGETALQTARDAKSAAMQVATGASPRMQSDAATALQSHLSDVNGSLLQKERDAWDAVNQSGATLNGPHVTSSVQSHIDALPIPDKGQLGSTPKYVKQFADQYGPDSDIQEIPISDWQSLRSHVANEASQAYAAGNKNGWRVNKGIRDLLDSHLEDAANLVSPSDAQTNAWADAVQATKTHRDIFGEGPASSAVATDANGELTRDPEKVISSLLSGVGGTQGVRKLRANPNINNDVLDKALADHFTGVLTKDGNVPDIGTADIDRLLRNPQVSTIASEVPAVADRFSAIRSTAEQHEANLAQAQADAANGVAQAKAANVAEGALGKIQTGFRNAYAQGPDQLNNFLVNNKDGLKGVIDPSYHPYIDQLHQNASLLSSPSGIGSVESPTLGAVARNDPDALFPMVYGEGANTAVDLAARAAPIAVAPIAAHSMGVAGPFKALMEAGILSRGEDYAPFGAGKIKNFLLRDANQSTAGQALTSLEGAMRDPNAAEALLNASTAPKGQINHGVVDTLARTTMANAILPPRKPEDADGLDGTQDEPLDPSIDLDSVPNTEAPSSGKVDRTLSDVPLDPNIDVNSIPEPQPTPHASGGRAGYRAGGTVKKKSVEHLVRALMSKAEKAKRENNKSTEPLLKLHDNTVAKALALAPKSI